MYNVADRVQVVSLQDNGITDEMLPLIMQIVFSANYLKTLDLRKNHLSAEGIRTVMESLTQIEGVTKVEGPPALTDEIRCSSGNQLRMQVWIAQQVPQGKGAAALVLDHELNAAGADEFLKNTGMSSAATLPLKPAQAGAALGQTASAPALGAEGGLPKLDLSRGAPKQKAPPAPPIAGGPPSQRSFGSSRSSHRV